MKLSRKDSLFQEEEAYKNKLFPTKKPISSSDIKRQLNNSIRSINSNNINKKNNMNKSNLDFEPNINDNIINNYHTLNDLNNNNILSELNYTNQTYIKNNASNKVDNNIINSTNSKIELNYCLGVIKNLKILFVSTQFKNFLSIYQKIL